MLLSKINSNFFAIILLCLFPLSQIIGQAVISINYFLVFLLTLILIFNSSLKSTFINNYFNLLPFFFFLILTSIYNFYSNEFSTPLKALLYIKNFFLTLMIIYAFQNPKFQKIFFRIIFFCCVFVAFDNYFQYFLGFDIFGYNKSMYRLTGPFGEGEYVTGAYLSKYLILIIPFYFLRNSKKINLISIFFLLFFFFSILISGERASLFSFLLGFFIFIIIYFKSIKKLFFFFLIFVSLILLAIKFNQTIQYKFLQTSYQLGTLKHYSKFFDLPDNFQDHKVKNFYDTRHGAHFLTAIEIWKNYKIIGVGPKNFSRECKKEKYNKVNSEGYEFRCNTHPHNIYLELLSETGTIGIVLFLTIIFLIFKEAFKLLLISKDPYLVSSFSQVVTIIWPLISSGSIISNFNGSFFWINLGILIAIINMNKNEKK